jgi:carbon starvation protein
MLAGIALCLATTIILKMQLAPAGFSAGPPEGGRTAPRQGRPWFALVTFIPLTWLIAVTFTAGVQKIFHESPKIGFLAQARELDSKLPELTAALQTAQAAGDATAVAAADKALRANRTLHFNNVLDACVAGVFVVLVTLILLMSVREWFLLLARKKTAQLRESAPVWLPAYAVAEGRPRRFFGWFALLFALGRELSGEAHTDRAEEAALTCACHHDQDAKSARTRAYLQSVEQRFRGVNRCC